MADLLIEEGSATSIMRQRDCPFVSSAAAGEAREGGLDEVRLGHLEEHGKPVGN